MQSIPFRCTSITLSASGREQGRIKQGQHNRTMRRLTYLTAYLQFVNPARLETAWRSASAYRGREREGTQLFRGMA